jgi:hypothetical protein
MLKSRALTCLLVASGVAAASFACSSGGIESEPPIKIQPSAGTSSTAAGSGSGGSGTGGTGAPTTAGSSPGTSGTGNGQAGSQSSAGTGGTGTGGTGTGGTGTGGTGGGAGGTGGGGGSGGGEDANKVMLYDGSAETFNSWKSVRNGGANPWKNNPDKTMTVQTNTGDIQTKMAFQDVFLHLEYMTPKITSAGGGQERGNSGIYMKGSWEVQVLDTFGLAPADDGCGAIYEVAAPLVSACKKEEEWNIYEIEFKAQVCSNGQQTAPAKFTEVKLNGIVVQKDVACPNNETRAGQLPSCDPKGILLQDHSSILPVSFRNIWVIPRN